VDEGRLSTVPAFRPPAAELAPDQRAAVQHGAGPARVLAPAGSGKTRVLTERLRHLLVDRGYEREGVLAVAYNVKARDEMVERTQEVRPRVQTLNGLGYEVVRAALGSAPPVLEEREVRRLVEGLLPGKRQRRVNTDPLAPYLEALGQVRLGLRDPADVERERGDVAGLAALFAPYRAALRERDAVDFDEQVYLAVELLLADGALRRRLQQRTRHLLVDEFQDLTPAHVLLLRLLACPRFDVFGVGDDDQVIYGHAGASPSFLIDFDALFPGAAHHALEVNHRCPVAVVDAARTLLSWNRRRVPKEIRAASTATSEPDALQVEVVSGPQLALRLARQVDAWLGEGRAPADIAVLTRVNASLLAPHVALARAGVPLSSQLPADLLSRLGTRAALAYLRLATGARLTKADLTEVYRRPSRGLPEWITKWFRDGQTPATLAEVADRIDDSRVGQKVVDLAADLDGLGRKARAGATTRELLRTVRIDIGLGQAMEQLDHTKGEGSSQLDDLEALEQVADLHPDAEGFEPWLRGMVRTASVTGGVTLSTVHRVKGREWPCVAVFGVTGGLLPHRLADDEEEERRVLHVALTRGRNRVVLLADEARPSPFLAQLHHLPPPRSEIAEPERDDPPEPGEDDAAVFDALRSWRLGRAKADGTPAYVLFHDATLRIIAERRPATMAELARVPGVGPTKLERYGADVLACLAQVNAY
jgi:DNA helicase-2/ATP-dependent DNA helicase PcrA